MRMRCSFALLVLLAGVYGCSQTSWDTDELSFHATLPEESPRSEGRPARGERSPRGERPQRERPARVRPERPSRPERPERPARPDRRPARPERRPERPEREPRRERETRPERPQRRTRPERPERTRPERPERPARPERRERKERPERPQRREREPRQERPRREPRRERPERRTRRKQRPCHTEIRRAKFVCGRWIRKTCPGAKTEEQFKECFIENRSNAPAKCENAAKIAMKCAHESESEKKCLRDFGDEAKRACWPDIQKFCMAELPSGFKPTFQCMMKNAKKLSAICRADSRNLVSCVQCKNSERNVFDQCMEVFVKVCKGTKRGEEESCFMENIDEFTPQCKAAVFTMKDTCARQEREEIKKDMETERMHHREHEMEFGMRREGDVMRKEEEMSERMPSMFALLF